MRHERQRPRAVDHAAPAGRGRQRLVGASAVLACFLGSASLAPAQDGKAIFDASCAPCHRIGAGRLVGPDLAGVNERRPQEWLLRYIKSEDALVKAGDNTAVTLREEYKMPMPAQALSEAQIKATLAYIKAAGGGADAAQEAGKGAAAPALPPAEAQPGEIQLGQDLFEGSVRFANGGPSCSACHHVTSDAVVGGGALAADLTLAFSRLGRNGLRGVISGAPFPVMKAAYPAGGFSDVELGALTAFLRKADQDHARQAPTQWGWRLFGAGVGGVLVLAGLAGLAGRTRKRQCVNQAIYDRQLRSE